MSRTQVLTHFILTPFLFGFIPWVAEGIFNAFWIGFAAALVLWFFGPIAQKRRKLLQSPGLTVWGPIWFSLLMFGTYLTGHGIGAWIYYG